MNQPFSLQLQVTNICASKCIMCKKKTWPQEEMHDEVLNKVLSDEDLLGNRNLSILLTGGDPFLYSKLDYLIDTLSRREIPIGILTAGNINVDWEKYVKNQNIKWIRVSQDASNPDTYIKMRSVDKFEKVMESIRSLDLLSKKYNRKPFFLRVNFTRTNINVGQEDELRKMLPGVNIRTWGLTWGKDEKIARNYNISDTTFRYCGILNHKAIIDTDGKVYPCCYLMHELDYYDNKERYKWVYGIIDKKTSFADVFYSDTAIRIRDWLYDRRLEECKYCVCYASENDIFQKRLEDDGYFL